MKIAVAADTTNTDAPVSMHAARAPCYLVYNENGELLDTITNPYHSVERGAAPRVTQLLQEYQINALVAGEFGGRFIDLLEEKSIAAVTAQGPANKAVKDAVRSTKPVE